MYNRKHKLPAAIIMVCIIGLTGFKDTGIFVKEYASIKGDDQVAFAKSEIVDVVKETEVSLIVEKGQNYKVIIGGDILNKSNGLAIRPLNVGEIVQAISYEAGYGIFRTTDGVEGYINLNNLQVVKESPINYGTSKVNKIIKQDKLIYSLVKGEVVAIKGFKDNMYIVVDENGNEFKVNETYIDRKAPLDKATRGNVSRRPSFTTKVVSAAYNELGKPYISGDTGQRGYDCSGLTYSLFLNNLEVKLNRTSRDQIKNGVNVKKDELIPGDLVFFRTSGSGIGHVGLYIGDGNMIHASSGRKKVMISGIDETYYKTRYVGATRIID